MRIPTFKINLNLHHYKTFKNVSARQVLELWEFVVVKMRWGFKNLHTYSQHFSSYGTDGQTWPRSTRFVILYSILFYN